MALKQLVLTRKLAAKQAELDQLRQQAQDIATRRAAMKKREEELEESVKEITEETEQEAKDAVEEAVAEFEADLAAIDAEEKENGEAIEEIEQAVDALKGELDELEKKLDDAADQIDKAAQDEGGEERSAKPMNTRSKFFGMNIQQRDAFFARQDVKDFAQRVRTLVKEKRAVSGDGLMIPQVMLPMIEEQVENKSQLLKYTNFESVTGTARQTIMGTTPEAVWTEMYGKINEIDFGANAVDIDGYKVAAFVPVPNALIEDNDVALVSKLIFGLGRAIALAVDKAILYGTGTKMPLGIVTRLAQTEAPADAPAYARPWQDLHTSNMVKITANDSKGITLYQKLIGAFGNAKKLYGAGGRFWAMNEKTHMRLVAEALNFNANGAIVSGIDGTMPVIGGAIEELDFIPDGNIIAGYGENYLLVERAGVAIESSEHARFIEDQTLLRGKARYDGTPVIPESFVVITLDNAAATTAMTFTADTANA